MSPRFWGHIPLPDDYQLVQRGIVRVGDEVISSHYGPSVVTEVQGCGKFCKSTTIAECNTHHVGFIFEGNTPTGDNRLFTKSERYERGSFIPRKVPTTKRAIELATDLIDLGRSEEIRAVLKAMDAVHVRVSGFNPEQERKFIAIFESLYGRSGAIRFDTTEEIAAKLEEL